MFDSLRLLTNSRQFRKRRYINRLQRLLKFLSLSGSLYQSSSTCVRGPVGLQRSCLSRRLQHHIGLIAPQETALSYELLAVVGVTPIPLSCLGDELQLLAQLEVSSHSSSVSFKSTFDTLTPSPLKLSHTLRPDGLHVSLPSKATFFPLSSGAF